MPVLTEDLWLMHAIPETPDPVFLADGFDLMRLEAGTRIPTIRGGVLGTYRAGAIHSLSQVMRPFEQWSTGTGSVADYLSAIEAVDTARAARSGPGGRRALREACRLRDALKPQAEADWAAARSEVTAWHQEYGDPHPQPVRPVPVPLGSW